MATSPDVWSQPEFGKNLQCTYAIQPYTHVLLNLTGEQWKSQSFLEGAQAKFLKKINVFSRVKLNFKLATSLDIWSQPEFGKNLQCTLRNRTLGERWPSDIYCMLLLEVLHAQDEDESSLHLFICLRYASSRKK